MKGSTRVLRHPLNVLDSCFPYSLETKMTNTSWQSSIDHKQWTGALRCPLNAPVSYSPPYRLRTPVLQLWPNRGDTRNLKIQQVLGMLSWWHHRSWAKTEKWQKSVTLNPINSDPKQDHLCSPVSLWAANNISSEVACLSGPSVNKVHTRIGPDGNLSYYSLNNADTL